MLWDVTYGPMRLELVLTQTSRMALRQEYYVELTKLADLRAKLAAPKVMDAPDPAGIALPSNLTLVK